MDMQMTPRRRFSDKFKATVALEALRGDKTVQQIAAKHRLHPTQVTSWKRQAIDGLKLAVRPTIGAENCASWATTSD